jgi:hypothetical protein
VDIVIRGKIVDEGDVEFRYTDLLTPDRLLRVVKAKKGIGSVDEVFGGMVDIDDVKGIIESRAREYVWVVTDFEGV